MKVLLLGLLLMVTALVTTAQDNPNTTHSQTFRGTVVDGISQQALIGATVIVQGTTPIIVALTDADGNFTLLNVPVGRQILEIQYIGYAPYISDGIIVTTAKEPYLEVLMAESIQMTTEVVVKASSSNGVGNRALNELSVVSTRSFSAEQTQRYAGSIDDPSRMAMAFPGVQGDADDENEIIIRGNSPMGMIWRLQGLDIENSSHFINPGSTGGGISALSVAVLGQSDFSSGAFAAEYGNAFAGVFDLRFRKGNRQQYDFMARLGIIGIDLAAEGPIKKGKSSFLFNYRYSTLGILGALGLYVVRENVFNDFQDLSFNLVFSSKDNKHHLKVFGLGGISSEQWMVKDSSDWQTSLDYLRKNFKTNMGIAGLNYTCLLDEKSYLNVVAGVQVYQVSDNIDDASLAIDGLTSAAAVAEFVAKKNKITRSFADYDAADSTRLLTNEYLYGRYSLQLNYSRKINRRFRLKTGLSGHAMFYNLNKGMYRDTARGFESLLDHVKGITTLVQAYIQTSFRPVSKLSLNVGLAGSFLTWNNSYSVEPRFSMKYELSNKTVFTAAYGLHAKMLPIGVYLLSINGYQPNKDLKMVKSHHAVLGFEQLLGKCLKLGVELYFQQMFDVPIGLIVSDNYWFYNERFGYGDRAMVSEGLGRNYGLNITVEKAFNKGWFMLCSGALYRSTYQTYGNDWRQSRLDGLYNISLMGAKEFSFKKGGILQLGTKLFMNGGRRYTPIDEAASNIAKSLVLDQSRAFESNYVGDGLYYRLDVRIAYIKSHPTLSYTIGLDIQNLTDAQNIKEYLYDIKQNGLIPRYYSGILPNLSFRLDF